MSPIWTRSCHTYERVMSNHIWTSQIMRMSHIRTRFVTHMNESCHIYPRVMSRDIWTSHVTPMNAYHTYERDMSHKWMSPYYTHKLVMSHTWTSRVARRNASCLWMCHVSHMDETRLTYERCMSHTWMSHVTRMDKCHVTCIKYLDHIS